MVNIVFHFLKITGIGFFVDQLSYETSTTFLLTHYVYPEIFPMHKFVVMFVDVVADIECKDQNFMIPDCGIFIFQKNDLVKVSTSVTKLNTTRPSS